MNPASFPESNRTLTAPSSMTSEQCADLPIWTDGNQCISCWKPTWKERLSILFFGRVWLTVVFGGSQPPVALSGRRDMFIEVEDYPELPEG